MASNQKGGACDEYITFETCKHGSQCLSRRRGYKTWKNEYFLGEIVKIFNNSFKIRRFRGSATEDESFIVDGHRWHRQDATQRQLVVFQASKREKNNLRCGRVVLLLGQVGDSRRPRCEVKVAPEAEAFTLYPTENATYFNAFSVDECALHNKGRECWKLGIHIPAMAWCLNEPLNDIPSFGPAKLTVLRKIMEQGNENLCQFISYDKGKRSLAISVYIHSSNIENAEGPILTPVYINENYTHAEFTENQSEKLSHACSILKSDELQKLLLRKHFWHLLAEQETYRAQFFVDDALAAHVRQTSELFRRNICEYAFAGRRIVHPREILIKELHNNKVSDSNKSAEYLVSDFHFTEAQSRKSTKEAAKWLTCSLQIMNFRETMKEMYKKKRFSTEIVKGSESDEDLSFCIFGQKGAPFLVTQQILIQSILGVSFNLYEKEDLIGINVPRYPEPKISKCLIRKNDLDGVHLNYIDLLGINEALMKLPYSQMGASVMPKGSDDSEVLWENFHCDEIECDKVFRVKAGDVVKCFSGLHTTRDPNSSLEQMQRVEMTVPFSVSSAGELIFTPVPGMIVRLQICDFAAHHSTQVGFRMIRLGKNGHICLAHMNSPQKMYSMDNENLQAFPSIENLTEASRIKKIYPTESNRMIRWMGKYNGGGWFKTELPVKKGQLLCIRKDIYEDDKVKYVWNAHGVVAEDQTDDDEVYFSVCSLSQPGETEESDDFVIEYIDEVRE